MESRIIKKKLVNTYLKISIQEIIKTIQTISNNNEKRTW